MLNFCEDTQNTIIKEQITATLASILSRDIHYRIFLCKFARLIYGRKQDEGE